MEKNFNMKEDIKTKIIEISKKAKEIDLGNLNFNYMDGNDFYTVSLTEYEGYWEVVHRGQYELSNKSDIYKLSFEGILEFDWSECD